MNRRAFVQFAAAMLALPGCALAAPFAFAQPRGKAFRAVYLSVSPRAAVNHLIDALERGLRDQGYIVGRDVAVDFRSADGDIGRYPAIVREVVLSKPDVIVTGPNETTARVRDATQSIPIVMAIGTDVVGAGLVRSLAKPGGNITGLTWDVGAGVIAKRLELLKEIAPSTARVAVLWEPPYKDQYQKATDDAALLLGLSTLWVEFSGDLARDFAEMLRWRADALLVHPAGRQFQRRAELNALAAKHGLPTSHAVSEFVETGGLMSYGPNLAAQFRAAARHIAKILKGAKPGDLPVEQPSKIDLVINLKTAGTLGLELPQSILLRADRVIE